MGLFTLLETVFPPIPSEIILPLAGFLSQQGRMNIVAAIIASTLGAYAGALLLYWLGAVVGWRGPCRDFPGCRWLTAATSTAALSGFADTGRRRCSSAASSPGSAASSHYQRGRSG